MKPIGKTYLIEVQRKNDIEQLDSGLYIPNDNSFKDIYYEGKVIAYGTSWTDGEIKDLVPIGKTVIFDYKSKKGTKIQLSNRLMYIHEKEQVVAIKEEDND